MFDRELPVVRVDEALRAVRALGKHRYVAGRMHFVHALAAFNLPNDGELRAWARAAIDNDAIDKASRDERLVRRATEDDLCAVLSHFWSEETSARACDDLLDALERFEVDVKLAEPFEDDDEMFPVLVDAGFELLQLAELDTERHRGAIEAFGERIHYDVARFEDEESIPRAAHLQELSAIGVAELVRGAHNGELITPLTLWLSGNAIYQEYVIRGVMRAAKIE